MIILVKRLLSLVIDYMIFQVSCFFMILVSALLFGVFNEFQVVAGYAETKVDTNTFIMNIFTALGEINSSSN